MEFGEHSADRSDKQPTSKESLAQGIEQLERVKETLIKATEQFELSIYEYQAELQSLYNGKPIVFSGTLTAWELEEADKGYTPCRSQLRDTEARVDSVWVQRNAEPHNDHATFDVLFLLNLDDTGRRTAIQFSDIEKLEVIDDSQLA